jgi:hypothetical protein
MYRIRDEILRWVANRRGIVVPSLLADIRQEEFEEEEALPLDDVLAGVRSGQSPNGSSGNGGRSTRRLAEAARR